MVRLSSNMHLTGILLVYTGVKLLVVAVLFALNSMFETVGTETGDNIGMSTEEGL